MYYAIVNQDGNGQSYSNFLMSKEGCDVLSHSEAGLEKPALESATKYLEQFDEGPKKSYETRLNIKKKQRRAILNRKENKKIDNTNESALTEN